MQSKYEGRTIDRYGEKTMYCHLSYESLLAERFATHFGLIAGERDGEDAAGRARLKTLDAEEVAARACDMAAALVAQFEQRGWIEAPEGEPLREASARRRQEQIEADKERAKRKAKDAVRKLAEEGA